MNKILKSNVTKAVATIALLAPTIAFIADAHAVYGIIAASKIDRILMFGIPTWMVLALLAGALGTHVVLIRYVKQNPTGMESSLIENQGQFHFRLQEMLVGAKKLVVIIGLRKEWVFPLIISIFVARSKGVEVRIIYYYSHHERYRLLNLMGCHVYYADREKLDVPLEGVLTDPEQILNCCAALHNPREKEHGLARYYTGAPDHFAIRAADKLSREIMSQAKAYSEIDPTAQQTPDHTPDLISVKENELIDRLREVRFYGDSKIFCEELSVGDVYPVSNYVVKFKLNQIKSLIHIYDQKGWKLFRPCAITLKNGKYSIVIPPVIEEHNGRLYIAEGHSRFYLLRQMGVKTVYAVVIRGITKELPLPPTRWSKVEVVDEKSEVRNRELARHIETSVHQDIWSKAGSYQPTKISPSPADDVNLSG